MAHSSDNSEEDKHLTQERLVLQKGERVVDQLRQLSGNLRRLAALHDTNVKTK